MPKLSQWIGKTDELRDDSEAFDIEADAVGLPLLQMIRLRDRFESLLRETNKYSDRGAAIFRSACVACHDYWSQRITDDYGLLDIQMDFRMN